MTSRYLLFAPSLAIGLLGALWLAFRPFPYMAKLAWPWLLLAGLLLTGLLLAGAWLLERLLPSFRWASERLERLLRHLRLSPLEVLLLAALSALAEELFFRAALLPLVGVWPQAVLFGLMHPAGRRGWSYTLYTFAAGALFGYATLLTGSLWPALLAHALVNFHGLWSSRRGAARKP